MYACTFLGKYIYNPKLKKEYKKELYSLAGDLSGLKIALDCANGASWQIAKSVLPESKVKIVGRVDSATSTLNIQITSAGAVTFDDPNGVNGYLTIVQIA